MEMYQLPIPKDVWETMVLPKLSLKDYIRCSTVCKCWRRIAAENQRALHSLPWVMLSQDEHTQTALFYSLTEGITYNLNFTDSASKSFCTGSTQGCFIFSDGEANFVFNPFSQHTTPLPPQYVPPLPRLRLTPLKNRHYYKKSVLSASDPAHLLVASLCSSTRLVTLTCSSNDKEWSVFERSPSLSPTQEDDEEEVDPNALEAYLEEVERWSLMDVIFYKGTLYGLSESSMLVRFNNLEDSNAKPQVTNMVPMELPDLRKTNNRPYLVESSCGDLLMVYRLRKSPEVFRYVTNGFLVFKLDKSGDELRWVAVKSLGDEMIFVGKNSSISFATKGISGKGLKGNCIYFTDDAFEVWPKREIPRPVFFADNGVFHLEDGRIESFLPPELSTSLKSQLIWVMPNKLNGWCSS